MPSKYKIIAGELRDQILLAKSLKPYKLPTEQELCKKYQVSRQTIRQALSTLEEENLITRRQGSGAYTVPRTEHLREKKIVLMISEDNEYTYPKFVADLRSGLRSHNLILTVCITHNDINIERKLLQKLLADSVSILVIEGIHSAFPNPNIDLYERLQFAGTKLIFINHSYPQLADILTITSNDMQGGYLLGNHFIANGNYDFAAILPDFSQNAKDRYVGIQTAYRDHQLTMPSHNIFWYSEKDLRALRTRQDTGFLTTFIRVMMPKYNTVFCYSDEIAYWLIKELSYAGISIPGQAAVASFDNSYLCTLSKPAITSLMLPAHEPAETLCRMVVDILHEKKVENKILPWELFSRGSTKSNPIL